MKKKKSSRGSSFFFSIEQTILGYTLSRRVTIPLLNLIGVAMTYRSAPVRVDTCTEKRKAWNRQDFKQPATIKQSTTTDRSGQTTHTTIFGYRGY